MGHLIPAGTGLPPYRDLRITLPFGHELEEQAAEEEVAAVVPEATPEVG